jgi:outer membrane protein assembly factor BamB
MRLAAAVLAVLLVFSVPLMSDSVDSEESGYVLMDMGDGNTYWSSVSTDGTYAAIVSTAAGSLGLDTEISGSAVRSIGSMRACTVGGQVCDWKLFIWSDGTWTAGGSFGDPYTGGSFAAGFYPSGVMPVETPVSMFSWTSSGGDSSGSSVSEGTGPETVATPLEWYRTYTTGYVCSDILVAGNLLYHTTNGAYKGSGEDGDPWLYCIDRLTGDIVWKYRFEYNGGYDTTTPVIIGDIIVANSAGGTTYCIDRLTGQLIDSVKRDYDYPVDSDGNVVWNGRTFVTGGTTPVYDSGAVYFGTSDGHVLCYSASRASGLALLWDYCPPATVSDGEYTGTRGSFYYHPPTITDVDGRRMLFIGSYEGYLYSLDAGTGEEVWVNRMIDLGSENRPHPGTPGSVSSISVLPGGRLAVSCNDGGLSSLSGYTICVDASTGKGQGGSAYLWKIDALCNDPAVGRDGFYTYVSPAYGGAEVLQFADGRTAYVVSAVCKFDFDGNVVWTSSTRSVIKAGLTLADGVLYSADYSAGSFWPAGGGVTAMSADDGSEVWRVRLAPYSSGSYSMVSPTVADGKVYVGNDYGAIYCLSETSGREYGDDGEIVLQNSGLAHWSWIVLAAVVALSLFGLYRFY